MKYPKMIKYYKLLDTLSRRSMTKEDLRLQIGVSAHKTVSLDVIDKEQKIQNEIIMKGNVCYAASITTENNHSGAV